MGEKSVEKHFHKKIVPTHFIEFLESMKKMVKEKVVIREKI